MTDGGATKKSKALLAIIGGMGPAAGVDFYHKLIEESPAKQDQDHIDTILYSFASKISDRTAYLEGKSASNPGEFIIKLIDEAIASDADYACMPCITAHADRIFGLVKQHIEKSNSNIEMISILEVIQDWCKENITREQGVGIIATRGTIVHKIIENSLNRIGFSCVTPVVPDQTNIVHDLIYNKMWGIKSASFDLERVQRGLLQVVDDLIERGAKVIVLGCTELPLAIKYKHYKSVPILDPTREMAVKIANLYYNKN